jgi:crotonobetainyl-CoA:carnitine CoA-transferase CaiB-like acyl-CoA transferase
VLRLLADVGAEVIKVERPGKGDDLRRFGEAETRRKVYARSKKSLSLNIRSEEGHEILLKLLETADVLTENFVPYAHKSWFGSLIEGMSGFAPMTGWSDKPPLLPPLALADMIAGLTGFGRILAAVIARMQGEAKGQVIDLSLFEPLFGILGPSAAVYEATGKTPQRQGNSSDVAAPCGLYPTKDGKHITMSASMQSVWCKLARAIGQPELIEDAKYMTSLDRIKNSAGLDQIIADEMQSRTLKENLDYYESQGVTVGPIRDISDLIDHPYIRGRGVLQDYRR